MVITSQIEKPVNQVVISGMLAAWITTWIVIVAKKVVINGVQAARITTQIERPVNQVVKSGMWSAWIAHTSG